ncbi:BrnA antitoxin family protein [Crocosphaera sp. UHCC 0190]|uniref:BrnA antitoxin family protein n=1 Tax=Crocosphaera sp. UHCC 0190 TaxID=3110246 RepID=UPI002B203EF3|nr:BrnA antitoxin family protein [Crocosphaera sp. UHCC 0190]MEA5509765.1 BrnA antitoxin family protein [Crocosphaera sp. UHCC 0190]
MSMSREEQLKILGQIKDSDIDYSDIPATDAKFWQEATVNPPIKVPVTLQLDPSVVAWYKQQSSQEYQTLINAVLEKYMLEHTC